MYTIRFIDSRFCNIRFVLSFKQFPSPHTAERIKEALVEVLQHFGIQDAIMSIAVDNAANNTKALSLLLQDTRVTFACDGQFYHSRCCAHSLHIIVKNALKLVEPVLNDVRRVVKKMKTPAQFQVYTNVLNENKAFASLLSVPRPKLDTEIRWNSTHKMLKAVCAHWDAICVYIDRVNLRAASTDRLPQFNSKNREVLFGLYGLLKNFTEWTNEVCVSDTYPTAHKIFGIDRAMGRFINEKAFKEVVTGDAAQKILEELNPDGIRQLAATEMLRPYNKYFGVLHPVFKIAHVLDCNRRLHFVKKYCSDWKEMEELFTDVYNKHYAHYPGRRSGCIAAPITDLTSDSEVHGSVSVESEELEFLQHMQSRITQNSDCVSAAAELNEYLTEATIYKGNLLDWWRSHEAQYPRLARMARHFLGVEASTMQSESAFSVSKLTVGEKRWRLTDDAMSALIQCRAYLQADSRYGLGLPRKFNWGSNTSSSNKK